MVSVGQGTDIYISVNFQIIIWIQESPSTPGELNAFRVLFHFQTSANLFLYQRMPFSEMSGP